MWAAASLIFYCFHTLQRDESGVLKGDLSEIRGWFENLFL